MTRTRNLIALGALVFVLLATTLRNGHVWGDSAHYIAHAVSIVEGDAYDATGYVFNPEAPEIGPRRYPPVTALMLAPIIAVRGLDYNALKMMASLCVALAALLTALAFRERVGDRYAAILVVAIGLNPVMWQQKDHITSDAPFLMWCMAALFAGDVLTRRRGGDRLSLGVVCGVLMGLAFATRAVGVVLPAALVLCDVLRRRRLPGKNVIAALLTFVAVVATQMAFMPSGGDYGSRFEFRLENVMVNVGAYARYATLPFDGGLGAAAAVVATAVVFALAGLAVVSRRLTRITVFETFAAGYVSLILIWPGNQGIRFLVPVLPLVLAWSFEGCADIGRRVGKRAGAVVALGICAVLVLSGAAWYAKADMDPWRGGVRSATARETFEWVTANTAPEDVILFRKPRCMALFADRKSSCWKDGATAAEFFHWSEEINATHVASGPFEDDVVASIVERDPARFALEFSNDEYRVYRIIPAHEEP